MLSVVLKSECGTAKLSLPLFVLFSCCSRYVAFVDLINLNDLLVDNIHCRDQLQLHYTPPPHAAVLVEQASPVKNQGEKLGGTLSKWRVFLAHSLLHLLLCVIIFCQENLWDPKFVHNLILNTPWAITTMQLFPLLTRYAIISPFNNNQASFFYFGLKQCSFSLNRF